MDPAVAALDFAKAGAILANMIESYLAGGAPPSNPEGADHDDLQDCRSTSVAPSLHLHSPVDDGAGPLQPGEHRAPVQSGEQGTVSRLERSNQDWHRLLELCAITGTLVIDEDGCYNPAEFNDGLVLGMKGTFAQAELHIIRARLHGGKLNKAHKGELHFALPVGFVFDDDKTAPDPDQEVQGAVRTVFELFERESSAYAVVRRFQEHGLRFPRRSYGGAWDGKLLWGRLTHSRVLGILANPSYAGTYVFGRHQARKQ